MKIIFIHGMNQQNYTAHRLKEHWLKVFKLGLKQLHCRVNLRDLHIHMPFYGDLMTKYQLSNQLDLNTLLPKTFNFHLPIHLHHQPSTPRNILLLYPTFLFHPINPHKAYQSVYI